MKSKKLVLFGLLCLLVSGINLGAQDGIDNRQAQTVLQDILGSRNDRTKLEAIINQYRPRISQAQAEIDLARAELNRALVPETPDRQALRAIIDRSLTHEANLRMAQLERQLDLRALLGDRRWSRLSMVLRTLREQDKNGQGPLLRFMEADPERLRLLELLRELNQ